MPRSSVFHGLKLKMRRHGAAQAFLPIICLAICFSAVAGEDTTTATTSKSSMVNQYCVACHNNKLKTGDLSLQGLDLTNVEKNADVWEKVIRKLAANEMPPAGMPHPTPAAEKDFTSWLESELDHAAAAHPNPGHPTIHRLNRNEYSNAVRDLLDLDARPGDRLPLDDTGYGFDNIGEVLSISPILLERYMSVARQVAALAVGDPHVLPVVDMFTPPKEVRAKTRPSALSEQLSENLPFGSAGGMSIRYTFPVDGEYVFKIKMPSPPAPPGQTVVQEGQSFELRVPVKAGIRNVGLTFMGSAAVPELIPVLGGRGGGGGAGGRGGPKSTGQLDLRVDGARIKTFEIQENDNPAFQSLSIAGPYNISGAGNSVSRQRVFVCKPASAQEEAGCAHKILATLARRAFRRPVTDTDLNPLLAVYRAGRAQAGFDSGIEMALRAILVSPDFLFRVERDPAGAAPGSVHRISDLELASRLSFFLWASIPDDQLLNLAEQGKLKDPAVLSKQVARMLDDPKSEAFVSNFAGQYLYTRNLAADKPDPDEYPEFDSSLRSAFEQETELFFRSIVRENRPVTELLDANYTYLNQRLAEFYKIPGVYGTQFRRVEISDPSRQGILGQGSLLTVTSYPNRTSVVQRGKWVLENLLGDPPPPPPANVPALDAHGKNGKMTMRQAMEEHRANPVCASCHARMDPIGFSLENFDGVGSWRDKDNGATIDASGKLPDGSTFKGSAGLSHLLLDKHRDEFIETFSEKLMIYALGRGVESYDMPALRSIIRDAAKQNVTIPALIDAIVKSSQFQMRRTRQS